MVTLRHREPHRNPAANAIRALLLLRWMESDPERRLALNADIRRRLDGYRAMVRATPPLPLPDRSLLSLCASLAAMAEPKRPTCRACRPFDPCWLHRPFLPLPVPRAPAVLTNAA